MSHMIKKRILLISVFKYRDLPGLILLKVLLEKKGNAVLIVNHADTNLLRYYIHKFRPNLIVFPQIKYSIFAKNFGLKEKKIGAVYILSEGEQFFKEFNLGNAGKFLDLSESDVFFTWNEKIKKYIKTHKTIPLGKCFLGGVPRFDFYREPFSKIILPKNEFCSIYNMNPDKPIISWSTNFGYIEIENDKERLDSFVKNMYRDGFQAPPVFKDMPHIVESEIKSRKLGMDCIINLAKKFPDAYIVIKVHPGETNHWYVDQVKNSGLNNIRIIQFEHIWNVLNATSVHLHRSCTTGVEAWFLDKPTVELRLNKEDWFFFKKLAQGSDVIYSYNECESAVKKYLAGTKVSSKQKIMRNHIIQDLYFKIDGKRAEFHSNIIHQWLKKQDADVSVFRNSFFDALSDFYHIFKTIIGLPEYTPLNSLFFKNKYKDDRNKYFSKEDVISFEQKIKEALNGH